MYLIDRYVLVPGCCRVCGAAQRAGGERIIDTLIDSEWEGRLYVCEVCTAELARMIGWHPPTAVVDAHATIAALQAKIAEQEAKLAVLDRLSGSVIEAFGMLEEATA